MEQRHSISFYGQIVFREGGGGLSPKFKYICILFEGCVSLDARNVLEIISSLLFTEY